MQSIWDETNKRTFLSLFNGFGNVLLFVLGQLHYNLISEYLYPVIGIVATWKLIIADSYFLIIGI